MTLSVRPSPIAGTWYPGDARRLAAEVDSYLDGAAFPPLEGEVLGVIAPHAGYRYSGAVAGHAFAAVRGRAPSLVAVFSPMHAPYADSLLTTAHSAYVTPLGEIPVDFASVQALDAALKMSLGEGLAFVANDPEHSLEIELPFLQRALAAPFSLLPVMVRSLDPRVAEALGHALAKVLRGENFLLVASTDLSHFYPQPVAERLDAEMLRQMEVFSPEGMFRAEAEGRGFACGLGASAAILWAARDLGADSVKLLRRATSGDVTGDFASVVGYGALAILKSS